MTNIGVVGDKDSPLRNSSPPAVPPAAIEMLAAQVQRMVEESGNPDGFDVQSWLSDWLYSPLSALGGGCPADYLHAPGGLDLISRMLASTQSGAYW